jgi:hypothetical protein
MMMVICGAISQAFCQARPMIPLATKTLEAPFTPSRHLDQTLDTLFQDDGTPNYIFRFPDAYGDDYRNQRFEAPGNGHLVGALFVFGTRGFQTWTTGTPTLKTLYWPMGADSLPDMSQMLLLDSLPFEHYSSSIYHLDSTWHGTSDQIVAVDLSGTSVPVDSGQWFHLGYTVRRNSPQDSLAILSDDGYPSTNYASEYYNNQFVQMREGWWGVNFLIRAIVDVEGLGVQVLQPGTAADNFALYPAFPNPFNPVTTISFDLIRGSHVRLSVFDILGRMRATLLDGFATAGSHEIQIDGNGWSSGSYFVRLETSDGARTTKIVLEK